MLADCLAIESSYVWLCMLPERESKHILEQ